MMRLAGKKATPFPPHWTYETLMQERLRPHRVLFRDKTQKEPALFIWDRDQTRQLGQGHGRTAIANS